MADRTENSAPLVQLAGLELDQNQLDEAEAVIARIRSRWKEAATGDVLEAQLALKRGNTAEAVEHFDAALKKDPDNKIVQFWKAQLDGRNGAVAEATKSLEAIVRDKPVKEVDPGTTLMSAAQSALANLSLRTGDFDDAIRRFEELKRNSQNGTLTKADRWQLITAYVTKGQVADRQARDRRDPQRPQEPAQRRGTGPRRQLLPAARRGRAAPWPSSTTCSRSIRPIPSAVVTRSYILLKAKQNDQAVAILRKAIELADQKDKAPAVFYLMLAAVENEKPPAVDRPQARASRSSTRASSARPTSVELVQAKYVAHESRRRSRRRRRRWSKPRPRLSPRARSAAMLVERLPGAEAVRPRRAVARRAAQGVPR